MTTIKHFEYCSFHFKQIGDLYIATPVDKQGCTRVRPVRSPRCWTKYLYRRRYKPETDPRMIDTLEAGVRAWQQEHAGPHGCDGFTMQAYDAPGQRGVAKRPREPEGRAE